MNVFKRIAQFLKDKTIIDLTNKWIRPEKSSFLTEGVVLFIQKENKCPYCDSELYEGPRGGMNVNLFCGNSKCNSRFNIIDPEIYNIPWGEFTGEVPESFYATLQEYKIKQKKGKINENG